jgi:hypothetical protein
MMGIDEEGREREEEWQCQSKMTQDVGRLTSERK